jgi:hypothetical protein
VSAVSEQEVGSDGELSKSGFHSAVQALVPRELLSSKERHVFSAMLNALFSLYDRDADGSVDAAEFIAGFSVFCSGKKSAKLSASFVLFDANNDGALSRRELWKFIRSFLTALFAVSGYVFMCLPVCLSVCFCLFMYLCYCSRLHWR